MLGQQCERAVRILGLRQATELGLVVVHTDDAASREAVDDEDDNAHREKFLLPIQNIIADAARAMQQDDKWKPLVT